MPTKKTTAPTKTAAPAAAPQRRKLHAPVGFANAAGRKLMSQTTEETFDRLSTCVESRCKICKLARNQRDLLVYINRSCNTGVLYAEVIAECAAQGVTLEDNHLTNHKKLHFEPMYREHLTASAGSSVLVELLRGQDLLKSSAAAVVSALLIKVEPIINSLDPAKRHQRRSTFYADVAMARGLARDLSQIQKAEAQTEARQLDAGIKALRLAAGEKKLRAKIMSELRTRFGQYPDVWETIKRIAAEADTPALPAHVDPSDEVEAGV